MFELPLPRDFILVAAGNGQKLSQNRRMSSQMGFTVDGYIADSLRMLLFLLTLGLLS